MPQQVLAALISPPAFEIEFRRFGRCNVACPVDVEHTRQNDAANRLVLGNEPAEIVTQAGEAVCRLRWPARWEPVKASGHMSAMAAAKLSNMTVGIQRGPQR